MQLIDVLRSSGKQYFLRNEILQTFSDYCHQAQKPTYFYHTSALGKLIHFVHELILAKKNIWFVVRPWIASQEIWSVNNDLTQPERRTPQALLEMRDCLINVGVDGDRRSKSKEPQILEIDMHPFYENFPTIVKIMVLDKQPNRSADFTSEGFGDTSRSQPISSEAEIPNPEPVTILTDQGSSKRLDLNEASRVPASKNSEFGIAGSEIQLLVVTQFFPPDFAATGQLIEELVHQFRQFDINVRVFTGQPGYAFHSASAPLYEEIGSLQVKRSRSAQFWPKQIRGKAVNGVVFTIRAALHLLKNHHRWNLLVVTTAPPFLPILGYLNYLLFKVPYVCVLYDIYPDIAIELGVIPIRHWLARFWRGMNERVWRNAQGLIVLSPDMKQRIVGHCPEVANKVSVIHSWSDPSWITPVPKDKNWFALRYDLVQPFTILYSGNMGRCHDMETILEAAKLLRDQPIQFVCIGNGAKRKFLTEQTQELGLNNVLFLPYQDREVLPYSLTACDLSLVSVSEGVESLVAPSKLYPALSAGRPVIVICPPHSYLNQLIEEAQCGKTFVNGDAEGLAAFIRLLMGDRDLAERMGQLGRCYLESHFTPKMIAHKYLGVLLQAMVK